MTNLVHVPRTIVGTSQGLENALRTAHREGRLVTPPEQIRPERLTGGRLQVRVVMREPMAAPAARPFGVRHPILAPCIKALAFGSAVVAVIAGIVIGIFELGYHALGAHAIGKALGAIVVASLFAALVGTLFSSGSDHGGHKGKGWHYTDCK